MALKEYAGGAAPSTITATINSVAASVSATDLTNWPTGATGDFWIVIDPDLSNEEKIRCDTRTGNTINFAVGGRGGDGTTATTHNSGAVIQHVFVAEDAREANEHIYNTALDPHTNLLNTTRHDVTARHTWGTVIPAATSVQDLDGDGNAGSGNAGSYGTHKHGIGAWTTYSPTISGFTVGDGALTARYKRIGKQLTIDIYFTAGSSSTFTGNFVIKLPTGLSSLFPAIGLVRVQIDGNNLIGFAPVVLDEILPYSTTTTLPTLARLSNAYPSATWSSGDGFTIHAANIELS